MKSSPERDASIERLLRQSLRAPEDAGLTDSCLDPETLAAWADGGLSREALELAKSHVADCARCQTLLGTLTRINAAVPAHAAEKASRRWLGWLVPLTAAAVGVTAVALWVAVPRNTGTRLPQATEEQTRAAEMKASPPAAPDDRANAAPNAPPAMGGLVGGIKPGEPQTPVAGAETREAEAKADSQAGARKQEELRRDAARFEADGAKAQSALAAAAPAAAAPPPPAERGAAAARSAAAEAPVVEIASPDPAVRWRIAGAVVQLSTNRGSSWATVSIGVQGQLTAGSAPSASVCWLVGRGGMVLLSTDGGGSWRRVAFPEPTDLSAIRASDARTASVTTVDGRTFSTYDGGLTWVRAAPQGF